jgi:hypothetical protein
VRTYGYQVLETWFNRVLGHIRIGTCGYVEALQTNFWRIVAILMSAWSHPNKGITHMVVVVYAQVLDLQERLVEQTGQVSTWKFFVDHALRQPVRHRGKYAALSKLLPKIGAEAMFRASPDIVSSLMEALYHKDIASVVASLVVDLVGELFVPRTESNESVQALGHELWIRYGRTNVLRSCVCLEISLQTHC